MFFSLIIPVFNRPSEIDELLNSLLSQTYKDFEIIIIEDGSTIPCREIVDCYSDRLSIKYYFKKNLSPAKSRNYGVQFSSTDYLIFLDSDCILPESYVKTIYYELKRMDSDAFGGADKAHKSFTKIQKAINYSMTSFFTTGGIRGGMKKLDKFYPRSFNLGIKRSVFQSLGGFSDMRFGEDIDLSIRIFNAGYSCRLFPDSWVYHKRRTDFKKFFKQVHNSGIARINLYRKYPESLKLVHILPALFLISLLLFSVLSIVFSFLFIVPFILFTLLILIDSTIQNRSFIIGILSVIATYIQMIGYGSGFIIAWLKMNLMKQTKIIAFEKNFYK